jgi:hypothetical protein
VSSLHVLDDDQAKLVRTLCELMVPGSERVWPEVYIDAVLNRMPPGDRSFALGAFATLAPFSDSAGALSARLFTPEFMLVRALACDAFYSDFVAPGAPGPGAYAEIDFTLPLATRIKKDWSYLGVVTP